MRFLNKLIFLIAALVLVWSRGSSAADLDIFTSSSTNTDTPNILLMLDNSANWDSNSQGRTKKEIVHEALYLILESIKDDHENYNDGTGTGAMPNPFNLAIMVWANSNSPKGGKVVQHWISLDAQSQKTAEIVSNIKELQKRLYCDGVQDLKGNKTVSSVGLEKCVTNIGDTFTPSDYYGTENIPKANNIPMSFGFHEAYQYFRGDTPRSGTGDGAASTTSYDDGVIKFPRIEMDGYDPGDATRTGAIDGSGDYNPPSGTGDCSKNFIIFISNGSPDNGSVRAAELALTGLGGVLPTDPIDLIPNSNSVAAIWVDEYARFLNNLDSDKAGIQPISTYVVDVFDTTSFLFTGSTTDTGIAQNTEFDSTNSVHRENYADFGMTQPIAAAHALMVSTATQGGGEYYAASNSTAVIAAVNAALSKIFSVNNIFASASLPVSVNVRGTNDNEVYMGVFRPEDTLFWPGNLKLYTLGLNGGKLELQDSVASTAEDSNTGFIDDGAISYWTAKSSYWTFTTKTDGTYDESDKPDGQEVERGGHAQQVRDSTWSNRNILTCTTCNSGSSLIDFNATNVTQSDTGASTIQDHQDYINWVRGKDVLDDNQNKVVDETRAWAIGDVVHSEPAVINYGNSTNGSDPSGVYVFFGANDGLLHAVEGGTDASDGDEVWAFAAKEHFGTYKEFFNGVSPNASYEDYANLAFPGTVTNLDDKPYFFDGTIGSYVVYSTNSKGEAVVDTAWLFVTPRRGGRFMYAFDVTDPEKPELLWHRDNSSTGWGELGQAWSRPTITKMKLFAKKGDTTASEIPVLLMGWGYDPEVDDPLTQLPLLANEGRGVAVINAETGDVIWQAGASVSGGEFRKTVSDMTYPIPAGLAVVDRNSDGFADRIYVGDTGAQLWRADIKDEDPSNWTVNKLLEARAIPLTDKQKFLHTPEVAISDDGTYDAIMLGTGDRESPLRTDVQDYFVFFRDYEQSGPSTKATKSISDLEKIDEQTDVTDTAAIPNFVNGWYYEYPNTGEKTVGRALIINQIAIFSTNEPGVGSKTGSCSQLGTARRYQINPFTLGGSSENVNNPSIFSAEAGEGLPPDPTSFTVDINGDLKTGVCIGPSCFEPDDIKLGTRERVYWYNNEDE